LEGRRPLLLALGLFVDILSSSPLRCERNLICEWDLHTEPLELLDIAQTRVTISNWARPDENRRTFYGALDSVAFCLFNCHGRG
jgi:hypothetical protein